MVPNKFAKYRLGQVQDPSRLSWMTQKIAVAPAAADCFGGVYCPRLQGCAYHDRVRSVALRSPSSARHTITPSVPRPRSKPRTTNAAASPAKPHVFVTVIGLSAGCHAGHHSSNVPLLNTRELPAHRAYRTSWPRAGSLGHSWSLKIVLVTIERSAAGIDPVTSGQSFAETACPATFRNGMAGRYRAMRAPGAKERSDGACVVRNTNA